MIAIRNNRMSGKCSCIRCTR